MDKGLLVRIINRVKETGLRSQAARLVMSKVPKTVFIALPLRLGYTTVMKNIPVADVESICTYFEYGGPYQVFLTSGEAESKTFNEMNWGTGMHVSARVDALMILEIKADALRFNFGSWMVTRRNNLSDYAVGARVIPITLSEHNMWYIDHTMIEGTDA